MTISPLKTSVQPRPVQTSHAHILSQLCLLVWSSISNSFLRCSISPGKTPTSPCLRPIHISYCDTKRRSRYFCHPITCGQKKRATLFIQEKMIVGIKMPAENKMDYSYNGQCYQSDRKSWRMCIYINLMVNSYLFGNTSFLRLISQCWAKAMICFSRSFAEHCSSVSSPRRVPLPIYHSSIHFSTRIQIA